MTKYLIRSWMLLQAILKRICLACAHTRVQQLLESHSFDTGKSNEHHILAKIGDPAMHSKSVSLISSPVFSISDL